MHEGRLPNLSHRRYIVSSLPAGTYGATTFLAEVVIGVVAGFGSALAVSSAIDSLRVRHSMHMWSRRLADLSTLE
ncbi:MAG: hypothetical protein ACREOM_12560 [Candidatus Dormibacteraceae bacterium]